MSHHNLDESSFHGLSDDGSVGRKRGAHWDHYADDFSDPKRKRCKCNYCGHVFYADAQRMRNHTDTCRDAPAGVKSPSSSNGSANVVTSFTSSDRIIPVQRLMAPTLTDATPVHAKPQRRPDATPGTQLKRILVTGGAGFLGLHLCKRLLDMGHDVICLDNLFTSQRISLRDLQRYENFEFVRHDVTEPYYCEVDEIFNLACPASPVHYQYNPIKTTKVSFLGALHMLGLAKRLNAKVLQASTSEVYGDPEVSPQHEEYFGHVNCRGVRSCYDEGKRVAETLFFDYERMHNTQIRVARIFNTYGPGMHPHDGRVVSNFILQALANEPITIYGDGSQTRSFCFVDDLVDGLIKFMDNPSGHSGPMNLGNPFEITILALATTIIRMTKSASTLVFLDLPGDDPKLRRPDITLAKSVLNWTPVVQLEAGLQRTIDYFKHLDLSRYVKPTTHTAHRSTDAMKAKKNCHVEV
ncbi:hypothetical protein H257_03110 [Aphanomyces astaci]|uniref:NAD-dependent epimerase/dehydratase domain-containing protein n=1 Tax=Aphanomyces astaci TaxID=112090 RepID=W4H261_APHAT|nr:hypothetical protein H257_03110 [Aphanomyces astaci]ETV85349.1 hypothetical protein H257_03110 [Aphanomyces astaci]|eukprot:XP_009825367.1 hypothetical protein H257_03110 [Aphanomyces astaci]